LKRVGPVEFEAVQTQQRQGKNPENGYHHESPAQNEGIGLDLSLQQEYHSSG
jgi:hypothetical protein